MDKSGKCICMHEIKHKPKKNQSLMLQFVCGLLFLGLLVVLYLYIRLSFKHETGNCFYYETSEWQKGEDGVHYSQDDPDMDSAVFIPGKNLLIWFHGRRLATVAPSDGQFTITWPNQGQVVGHVKSSTQTLVCTGVPGTSEAGVAETMIRV